MSIIIKGMEMPKEGFVELAVHWDGLVQQTGQTQRIDGKDYYSPYIGVRPTEYEAIELPPHGRLIDGDKLAAQCDDPHWCVWLSEILDAPTIIEAEGEE